MNVTRSPPVYFSNHNEPVRLKKPRASLLDLALAVTICTLSFLTIDSYNKRNNLQALLDETKLKHKHSNEQLIKQLNSSKKQRDLRLLNERKCTQARNMKLSLHIAMLKKQLVDNHIAPKTASDCNQEFVKSIRMENSLANVTATRFWIHGETDLKQYVPDVREYDNS